MKHKSQHSKEQPAKGQPAKGQSARSLGQTLGALRWTLASLLLAVLVVCVLPASQIRVGASQLRGLIGSYSYVPLGPDFALSDAPNSLGIVQGGSGPVTTTITPLNGFSGTVSLSLSEPSGALAPAGNWADPTKISYVFSSTLPAAQSGPTTNPPNTLPVSVPGPSARSVALTLTVGRQVPLGTYKLTVTGASSSPLLSHTDTFSLTVGPPVAPVLTATAQDRAVFLQWTPTAGATGYNVYRSTASGRGYFLVGPSTNTTDTDGGLTNGTAYYYLVSPILGGQEAGRSNEATATPVAPPSSFASFTLDQSQLPSGARTVGTLSYSAPVPAASSVALSSNPSAAASLPAGVQVQPGARSAKFYVTAQPVAQPTAATLTATAAGVSRTAPLNVTPTNYVLHLTQAGINQGFQLTTLVSGFTPIPNNPPPTADDIAATYTVNGSAYVPDGHVLVSDSRGKLYRFNDQDNQVVDPNANTVTFFDASTNQTVSQPSTFYTQYGAPGCLRVVGSSVYLAAGSGIYQLNFDGSPKSADSNNPTLFSQAGSVSGIDLNPRTGHLIGSQGSSFVDIDLKNPDPSKNYLMLLSTGQAVIDGVTVSSDGQCVFGANDNSQIDANRTNTIEGYRLTDHSSAFSFRPKDGSKFSPDGMSVGRGSLSGYLFANTNGGDVYEISLINQIGPNGLPIQAGTVTVIATGGSRGDYIGYGSHGSLLLSQTDRIVRLIPPPGSQFGGETDAVATRDDAQATHQPIVANGSALTGQGNYPPNPDGADPARFDTVGLRGTVTAARMQRAGQVVMAGVGAGAAGIADVQPGLHPASGADTFSLPVQALPTASPYVLGWDLPDSLLPDIGRGLGGQYGVTLRDQLSSLCGNVSLTDTPQAQGFDKNLLSFIVSLGGSWPQLTPGRSQDLTLSDVPLQNADGSPNVAAELPFDGFWDVVQSRTQPDPLDPQAVTVLNTIVASSGQPGGWGVEPDGTAYRGVHLSVPASAAPSLDPNNPAAPYAAYKVRCLRYDANGNLLASLGYFHVAAADAGSAPVLLPLALSAHPVVAGASVTGMLTLDRPAPAGGATITLKSSNPAVAMVPGSIHVPAGATAATFPVATAAGSPTSSVGFLASYNGFRQVWLTVFDTQADLNAALPADPSGAPIPLAPGTLGYGGGDPPVGRPGGPGSTTTTTVIAVPGAPSGLSAKAGDGIVTLTWSAPTSGAAVTCYAVARKDNTDGAGSGPIPYHMLYMGALQTQFTDNTVQNGTTYAYVVFAVNAFGFSRPSGVVVATPSGGTVKTPTTNPAGSYTAVRTGNVSVSDDIPGSTIYYTTDGTDPTPGSTAFGGFLTFGNPPPAASPRAVTVKARAYKPGWAQSAVAGVTLTVNPYSTPATTPLNPGQSTYYPAASGSLTASSGASLMRGQFFYADHYSLTGAAGQRVSLTLKSAGYGGGCLYLLDAAGNVVSSAGDGGATSTTSLSTVLPAAGTYMVEVTTFFPFAAPSYSLFWPAAPQLLLSVGGKMVSPGDGVNFGTTAQGTPVAKTFTVTNLGNAALNLGAITVPAGYALSGPASTSVAAGATTTFSVTLGASAAGSFSGPASVPSDDPGSPLAFNVSGTVTAATGPDFGLSLSNGDPSVPQGGGGPTPAVSVKVTPLNGFTGAVALSLGDDPIRPVLGSPATDPTKVGSAFKPSSVTLAGTAGASAALTFTVGAGVPLGTYHFQVLGNNGVHAAPVTLTVTAPTAGDAPPTVTLTAPQDPASLTGGTSLTLAATAGDSDGTVSRVDFVATDANGNSATVGTDTGAGGSYGAVWSDVPPGSYTLTAVATDNVGLVTVSAPVRLTVSSPLTGAFGARIDSPVTSVVNAAQPAGATAPQVPASATPVSVTGPTTVSGAVTAGASDAVTWELDYRLRGDAAWTAFGAGAATGGASASGLLDTTLLLNGLYDVRLLATAGTQTATAGIVLLVQGNQKVGYFTQSYVDLTIPAVGQPIQVVRTYDSRAKGQGDFGAGWTLSTGVGRSQKSVPNLGTNWTSVFNSGGNVIVPTKPHLITITLPGGAVYMFQSAFRDTSGIKPYSDTQGSTVIQGTLVYQQVAGRSASLTGVSSGTPDSLDGVTVYVNSGAQDNTLWADISLDYAYDRSQFQLTTRDGRKLIVNPDPGDGSSNPLSGAGVLQDRNGNSQAVTTDGQGHITGITASSGGQVVQSVTLTRVNGMITDIQDPNGHHLLYGQDATTGDLTSFTDRANNITTYDYVAHNLTAVHDPRNVQPLTNFYGPDGRLQWSKDADGKEIDYSYDVQGRRQGITDRLGNVSAMGYDAYGNVTSTTQYLKKPDGTLDHVITAKSDFADPSNPDKKTADTDATGRLTQYQYRPTGEISSVMQQGKSGSANLLTSYTPWTGNQFGEVWKVQDAKHQGTGIFATTNTYDAKGNLQTAADALGNTTTYSYNPNGTLQYLEDANKDLTGHGKRTSFSYAASPTGVYPAGVHVTTVVDAQNHVKSFDYDKNGNKISQTRTRTNVAGATEKLLTRYVYDADDRLIETDVYGTDLVTVVSRTQTFYNGIGKVDHTVDAGGRTTSYKYDAQGRQYETDYPDSTSTKTTFDLNGQRLTNTDRAGRVTASVYDSLGRAVQSGAVNPATPFLNGNTATPNWLPDAGGNPVYSQTTYDDAGQVTAERDLRGNVTRYTYDDLGRKATAKDAALNVTLYNNAAGSGYDADGNQIRVVDAKGHVTTFLYDDANRLIETDVLKDGTTTPLTSTKTSYDALGRRKTSTDGDGHVTTYGYDEVGRLTSVQTPKNTVDGKSTSFTYDELGEKTSQTDANGHTTSFEYDIQGRVTRKTLPAGQSMRMAYNADGTLATQTDFNGLTTTYNYEPLTGRLSSKVSGDGQWVAYDYTPDGQRQDAYRGHGDLKAANAASTLTYAYFPTGDFRQGSVQSITGPNGALTYDYDAAGNRTSLTTTGSGYNAGAATTTYGYDADNRLWQVNHAGGGTSTYLYDADGNRQTLTLANGVATTYAYDEANRLTGLVNRNGAGAVLSSYGYTLYPSGRRWIITDAAGATTTYKYDPDGRLTNEDSAGLTPAIHNVYGYDFVGNRTGLNGSTLTYDADDRVTSGGHAYDGNGNELLVNGVQASYDFENHLVQLGTRDYTAYSYDADGNRLSVATRLWAPGAAPTGAVSGTTTVYLVDPTATYARVVLESSGGYSPTRYEYGDDLLRMVGTGGASSYYLYDGLGSTRQLTDGGGAVTDSYLYDAYGVGLARTGSTANSFLFQGQQYDPATGTYYLRARYYDQNSGRFLSQDPFGGSDEDPISLHRYLYASCNPVNDSDPSGMADIGELSISITSSLYLAATRVTLIHAAASVIIGLVDPDFAQFLQGVEGGNPVFGGEDAIGASLGREARSAGSAIEEYGDTLLQSILEDADAEINNIESSTAQDLRQQCWNLRQEMGAQGLRGSKRFARGEGNVAAASLSLDGEGVEQYVSTSSKQQFNVPGLLNVNTTQQVAEEFNQFHSETKIFQRIFQQHGQADLRGTLTVYSERKVCPPCQRSFDKFQSLYPNLNIRVITSDLPYTKKFISAP